LKDFRCKFCHKLLARVGLDRKLRYYVECDVKELPYAFIVEIKCHKCRTINKIRKEELVEA